jgi:LuxR family transcriptional regulator, quorum-sensing system regulator BjaR1
MASGARRNFAFETVDAVARLTSLPQISEHVANAMAKMGFTSIGIASFPPAEEGAEPVFVTDITPPGFRAEYAQEQLYQINYIAAYSRIAVAPFRYDEAPYDPSRQLDYERFTQMMRSYGLREGIMIPVGRVGRSPAWAWFSGESPDLDEEAVQVVQLIALFASSKTLALFQPDVGDPAHLTAREREVLTWAALGKSSWEIGQILNIAKRTVDEHTQIASRKLGAANRTQAVALALVKRLIGI